MKITLLQLINSKIILQILPLLDQTPTPTRFIRNCEEVGLYEDWKHVNIFDETFRRAVEEKSDPSKVRRMISIQNEDTLHTPQILPHLDTAEVTNDPEPSASGNYFAGIGKKPETASPIPKTSPKPLKTTSPKKTRPRTHGIEKLLPPKDPIIPVAYTDAIQIQPKWTVVLQYPTLEKDMTVKEKLKTLLVKNESSSQQTISLGPPPVPGNHPPTIFMKQLSQPKVPLKMNDMGSCVAPKPKTPTVLERNNEAAKRYRNRKNMFMNNLKVRNEQLEQENKRLKQQNAELMLKLKEALEGVPKVT